MPRLRVHKAALVALSLALTLTACGVDEPDATATATAIADASGGADAPAQPEGDGSNASPATGDTSPDDAPSPPTGDNDNSASDPGYADVTFLGTTTRYFADEVAGCFLSDAGGDDGGLSFGGNSEGGSRLILDWSDGAPESSVAAIEPGPDVAEWATALVEPVMSATLTDTTADISAELASLDGSGDVQPMTAWVVCE